MEKVKALLTEEVRAYIYRVLLAVGVLLTGYGYLSQEQVAVWMGLLTAVLNIMPTLNTSTKHVD
jgi:hypothetical protein